MSRPIRLSRFLLIVGAIGVGAPLAASAQFAGPHIQAGLWQTDMDLSGMKIGSQICMDGSEAASRRVFSPPSRDRAAATAERECEKQDVRPIPGGYAVDTTCTRDGRVTHVKGTVTGDFTSRYKMDMSIDRDGRPPQLIQMESHRLGECPAGMKPGEAHTTMNRMDIAAAIAAARAGRGQ